MNDSGFSFDLGALGGNDNLPDPETIYDLIIVGGGPAAMTAALYAARKVMKIAVITQDFGGQVGTTSWVDNYMGFQSITGKELVEKFKEQVEQFEIPLLLGEKITGVTQDGDLFKTTTENGQVFQARTFIISTGKRHKMLNVPGEEKFNGSGVAYCAICDAPFYKGKKVVVVGGGNSGFTAGIDLAKLASHVTLINHSPGFKADPVLQESLKKYPHVKLKENTSVVKIEGGSSVNNIVLRDNGSGKEFDHPADGIFVEIGLMPNSESVKDLVALNEFREVIVDCNCRTSVPGFYGAGDVTTVPYKQIVISAGEGAKAALSAYDYLTSRGLI